MKYFTVKWCLGRGSFRQAGSGGGDREAVEGRRRRGLGERKGLKLRGGGTWNSNMPGFLERERERESLQENLLVENRSTILFLDQVD